MVDFIQKFFWRIKFSFVYGWRTNPAILIYTIIPYVRNKSLWRENFLVERGYIIWDREESKFRVGLYNFCYQGQLPIADIISILLGQDPWIRRNFVKNNAFAIEGPYEEAGVWLKKEDVVIDVGANIGIFSVYAASKASFVYSCEPIMRTRELLEKNVMKNRLPNVKIVPVALGAEDGQVFFSVNKEVLGDSIRGSLESADYKERVEQKTLDEVVEEQKISKVDFIKADIEGAEREMLKGAEKTIRKYKPKLAICTYHLPDDPEVIEGIIKKYVPEYKIYKTRKKIFAWI